MDKVNVVKRQTNYNEEEITELLKNGMTVETIIKEYMTKNNNCNIKNENNTHVVGKNQIIYSELGKFMDGIYKSKKN